MNIAAGLVVALSTLTPAAAMAVDYRVMGEDERAISVIEAAMKTDSEGRRETVFFIAFSQPVNGPGSAQVVSSTILFDCPGARYKVGASAKFTADMTVIERGTEQYSWRNIVPDSPFSRAGAFACKGEALPKADAGEVKAIVARYLDHRAALATLPVSPAEPRPGPVLQAAKAPPAPSVTLPTRPIAQPAATNPDALTCERYGYKHGQSGFADCMMQIDMVRQSQARADAEYARQMEAYRLQVAAVEEEQQRRLRMRQLEFGLRLLAGGGMGGSEPTTAAMPTPPQSPSTTQTFRLPNGTQVFCQTLGNFTSCR